MNKPTFHSVIQGSEEWHALRAKHYTASEAPAMLGVSKYQTRSDLLCRKATGLAAEIDAGTQRRFDAGHAAEAAARPIVEGIIGDELFPVTMTAEVNDLPLLASMDGLTMLGDIGWETKLLNQDLRGDVEAGTLHEHYTVQMEQQLMVSGAQRIYFTTSDGTPEGTFGMWYESNPELRARIVAGWKQFAADLEEYEPHHESAKPIGVAPETLPALRIEVTGMVTASNLDAFREHALTVFSGINTELQTDADFADAEKTVKWCKEVEDRLEAAKQHALSQTESIDLLFRTIDAIKAEARAKRLELDKLVKTEKEHRKAEIVRAATQAFSEHLAGLQRRTGVPIPVAGKFADVIKGLKSLDSMRDKVSSALANAKIEANAIADRIDANRQQVDDMSLVPDFAQVCTKSPEDFAALVAMRKQQRAEAEAKRLEAERARIRAEEEAKARAEAEHLAQVEREKIRAEEQAKAQESERMRQEQSPTDHVDGIAPIAKPSVETAVETEARIKLGQINQLLSPISLSEAGLAQLGIEAVGKERSSVLYRERDFLRICEALIAHLTTITKGI